MSRGFAQPMLIYLIAGILLLGVASGTIKIPFSLGEQVLSDGCDVVLPKYGYYACKATTSPADEARIKDVFNPGFLGQQDKLYGSCRNKDVAGDVNACKYVVDSGKILSYKICSTPDCSIIDKKVDGNAFDYAIENGESVSIDKGKWFYIITDVYAETTFSYNRLFLEYKNSQTGYYTPYIAGGCDLSQFPTDVANFPAGAKSTLGQNQVQNFVVGFDRYPMIGNVINHPSYGKGICEVLGTSARFHTLSSNQIPADFDPTKAYGLYKFYNQYQQCLAIPEPNGIPVTCCPGQPMGSSQVCGDNFQPATSSDVGCIKGGIASDQNCAYGGAIYVDLGNNIAHQYSKCNPTTGQCTDTLNKYAECDPQSGAGCAGGQTCDKNTFRCISTASGLFPCNFECCTDPTVFSSLKSCKDGYECKLNTCVAKTPSATMPSAGECTGLGGYTGGVFGIGKKPCCGSPPSPIPLYEDDKGYCREGSGQLPTWIPYAIFTIFGAIAGFYFTNNQKGALFGGALGFVFTYLALLIIGFIAGNILLIALVIIAFLALAFVIFTRFPMLLGR